MCRTCFLLLCIKSQQWQCNNYLQTTNHVQKKKKKLQIVLQKEKNKSYPEILYSEGGERTWAWLSQVSNSASGAQASKQAHFRHCKEGWNARYCLIPVPHITRLLPMISRNRRGSIVGQRGIQCHALVVRSQVRTFPFSEALILNTEMELPLPRQLYFAKSISSRSSLSWFALISKSTHFIIIPSADGLLLLLSSVSTNSQTLRLFLHSLPSKTAATSNKRELHSTRLAVMIL